MSDRFAGLRRGFLRKGFGRGGRLCHNASDEVEGVERAVGLIVEGPQRRIVPDSDSLASVARRCRWRVGPYG